MHFAHLSAHLFLASTVAATPRHPLQGKWEYFHHRSSFPSLEDASSAGFTMPSGTGTAPVIPQGTVLVTPPKPVVSNVPSVSSTESGEDHMNKEAAKPEGNSGLPSSSAPANASSSTPAAAASQPAPTTPTSSSSGSAGVSYSATFTEYVVLCSSTYLSLCPSIINTDKPQIRAQRRQRLSQLQRCYRLLRLLQHPRVQCGRFTKPIRCRVRQDR